MERKELVPIEVLCGIYEIEFFFFESLCEAELIEIIVFEDKRHVYEAHIATIEQIIRIHKDLDVNIAGIDIILNLLQKVDLLSEKVQKLENKFI